MAQPPSQFTPSQVLQAARRAEAEGKMDYALQFYRHLVEHNGTAPEAQEAREGLFRIAEWRWGETRGQRGGQNGSAPAMPGRPAQPTPPEQSARAAVPAPPMPKPAFIPAPAPAPGPAAGQAPAYVPATWQAEPTGLPVVLPRAPAFVSRYKAGRFFAVLVSIIGWLTMVGGAVAALVPAMTLSGTMPEIGGPLGGLSAGLIIGLPLMIAGLVFVFAGQISIAVFDTANATRELLEVQRNKPSG